MKIICNNCKNIEKTNLELFVKIIGGALPFGGYWAWVTYLFAGTGLAMPIVLAIMTGGVAMLVFKDQIVEWIISNKYNCSQCGECDWLAE